MKKYQDIMQYESDIWAAADLLIAAGIKQSKFPEYMMPYFALVMLESRMRREIHTLMEEEGLSREDDLQEFIDAFKDLDCGYNEYIVEQKKTLADICKNDKTFEQDYKNYLNGFDNEIKTLLGVERGTDESKFLNITGISAELKKKGILYSTVSKWSEIDFTDFDNSEITTLEEHIKRKWADISAETAGEQYTPNDIISLISEIVGAKVENKGDRYLSIYDPTCGGGNLLFGVGDRLQKDFGHKYVQMYGRDFNDSLYALAAIESRFRNNAKIEYGNTLTARPFNELEFDVVVANPPYGISWKGYEKDVRKDETGQFKYYPSVSDGQLLFMQHIVSRLNKNGFAIEVHNGSTLFSGDAGGGESNIRKFLFDNDWVEAIIQMPSDEFFNTGIFTYLWIMNKNKSHDRKNKVILINGSNGWKQLKKSRGSKRREMLPEHREAIVDALLKFEDNDIAKVFDKWHFYYNKQALTLINIDDAGKTVLNGIAKEKAFSLKPNKIYLNDISLSASDESLALLKNENTKDGTIHIVEKDGTEYRFDKKQNTIIRTKNNETTDLGCGKFTFKLSKNKKEGSLSFAAAIETEYISDYEIISYKPDPEENKAHIKAFMDKYISKPYYLKDEPTVGVELNFNKEFYAPEKVEKVDDILNELAELERELRDLEGGLVL
ncbi:SAM-dependent methyltransferase [Parabacteroides sp. OttesenSCG-928-J18]|nr:SAM-dependent methyltransferase [Parabacteroides sp. OttesenSCG-928-J18]